jgi:hypothetical protein
MSGDVLVYEMASASEGSASIFVKKDWLSILDNQAGNYRSNQSVIDTSQLANSNKYMNYREAYLAVPMVATLTGVPLTGPATGATSMDYAMGLKNWFGSVIHSFTLDISGTTIIQQTPYCGLWNTFKLMTSLSWDDVSTIGASIGFYPDDALAVDFFTNAGSDGLGTCNNQDFISIPVVSGALNSYNVGNEGFLRRQQYINYDPAGLSAPGAATYQTFGLTAAACNNLYKSYISTKTNPALAGTNPGVLQISIMAQIQLKHLHSFFQSVPLLKGVFMKATLNLNQPQITLDVGAGPTLSVTSVNSPLGGVNPLMIASARGNNGSSSMVNGGAGGNNVYASLFVGNTCYWTQQTTDGAPANTAFTNSITLNVPAYTFNPVYEQAYLSQPVKRIVYTDIYQYQVLNVAAGAQFNQLITNGIAGIKSVLVLPFFTASANGTNGVDPILSPFDPAGGGPTSPLCLLNNFNVVVSGQNMIYNSEKYSYEQFLNQLYGCGSVNAGLTDGLTSGFIDQLNFDTEYNYYWVNCGRMLPVEEPVPKSVSIIGTNQSAKALNFYVFVEYGVEIAIDVLSGARV